MEESFEVIDILFGNVRRFLRPYTLTHFIALAIVLIVLYYLLVKLLRIRWVRWLYMGILVIAATNFYRHGKKKEAVKDIFKLALV